MSKINDGGPAFPCEKHDTGAWDQTFEQGMSLRDWLAGKALGGLIASPVAFERSDRRHNSMADNAYKFADAMLKAREAGE